MRRQDNQVKFMIDIGVMKANNQGNHKRQLMRHKVTNANRIAKIRGLPGSLTIRQWKQALKYFGNRCAVCGRDVTHIPGASISMDHWLPLSYKSDDNPGTVAKNVLPLCLGKGGCNNSKSYLLPALWLERRYGKYRAQWILRRIQKYFDSLQ